MSVKIVVILLGLLSAGLSIFMATYAFRRRTNTAAARPFVALMIVNACYALIYTAELQMPTKALAILFLKCEYMAVALIPVLWFLFARSFSGRGSRTPIRGLCLILIIPVLTILFMWTNELHGLVFVKLNLNPDSPVTTFAHNTRGPWYLVSTLYFYVLLMLGSIRMIYFLSKTSGDFQDQTATIVVAVLLPWLGHLALLVHVSPWNIDLGPFAFTISGIFLTIGVFKLRLFDLVPIAREKVVDAIQDGVIVLDNSSRIVDHNPMAREIFPTLETIGPGIDFPAFLAREGPIVQQSGNGQVFAMPLRGETRWFNMTPTPVQDERGKKLGTALILQDITEIRNLIERLKDENAT